MTIERQRTNPRTPSTGRVLRNVSHGGEGGSAVVRGVAADTASDAAVSDTAFNYMFTTLAEEFPAHHLPNTDPAATVAALKRLGAAMVEDPASPADPFQSTENSTIPPVYTYWGQFIDHDLTLNTDGSSDVLGKVTDPTLAPVAPAQVAHDLRNSRDPALNLDSVYGDGPTLDPAHPTTAADQYVGIKFDIGTVALLNTDGSTPAGTHVGPPGDDRDLPRTNKLARIGDGRNDENLIIAQLHSAVLHFHNAAVDWVVANEPDRNTDAKVFRRARQLTRWHYQWLVVNDYLKTVTISGSTDKVLLRGNQFFNPLDDADEVFMPLEFSIAGFRFGHSMVRGEYDFNQNFGRPGLAAPAASFFLIFAFTGKGFPQPFFGATDVLPFNWVIDWDRFVHKGSSFPDHFARKIDTRLTPPLRSLSKEGNAEPDPVMKSILKSLATRNLLRGYLLSIPTGQAVAATLGETPLTANQLTSGNNAVLNDALTEGGFTTATPLWFYILKEAEVQANGDSLGEVGSRIVNETIIGQLRADSTSYLNRTPDWDPTMGLTLPNGDPIVTIADFLTVAGVR
jgi:hypothetical protein